MQTAGYITIKLSYLLEDVRAQDQERKSICSRSTLILAPLLLIVEYEQGIDLDG